MKKKDDLAIDRINNAILRELNRTSQDEQNERMILEFEDAYHLACIDVFNEPDMEEIFNHWDSETWRNGYKKGWTIQNSLKQIEPEPELLDIKTDNKKILWKIESLLSQAFILIGEINYNEYEKMPKDLTANIGQAYDIIKGINDKKE